jgi:hypothetical protein
LRLLFTCLKWCNTYRSNPTSTPLHHTFYVMISVTFPVWRKSKLAFPSAGWRCWWLEWRMGLQQPISKWIPNTNG